MRYSVCIINWNYIEILKPTIDNLRKERETVDLEIIVLDNGSKDGSPEWLKDQTDIIAILNPENVGSAIGRNQMIKIAKGDYILMLDSDILYINGSLDYLESRFKDVSPNAKCIGFNPNTFTNDLNNYKPQLPALNAPMIEHHVEFASYALTQYGLFKKDMFEEVMFDENYGVGYTCEDDDLFMQMQLYGWSVYQLECCYYHAKLTKKWWETHDLTKVNHGNRAQYFRKKWGWDRPKGENILDKTNIFKKYNYNNYFVETGSYKGEGIQKALEAKFKNIISVEITPLYFDLCVKKFKQNKNVKIIMGDSSKDLGNIISKIKSSITFWLDGHYTENTTLFSEEAGWFPLMQELEAIKNHKIKKHTIIVNDMRCFHESYLYFNKHNITKQAIINKILEINTKYQITYVDGYNERNELVKDMILVAQVYS